MSCTLLCLHLLVPRYQQRPVGSNAAAAGPVPCQGPQQPLHGAVGPGDDTVLTARVWKGKFGSLPWVWEESGVLGVSPS